LISIQEAYKDANGQIRYAEVQNASTSCLEVKRRFLLRDTFAGKNLTEIRSLENISEKLPNFYRQKCRAGVRTEFLFLIIVISHLHMHLSKINCVK
jgi:hypothetical protein